VKAPSQSKKFGRPRLRERLILQAAGQLFAEVGYGRASMELIASKAGVTKATLYAYFPDKATLFREVIQHWLAQLPKSEFNYKTWMTLQEQITHIANDLIKKISHPSAAAIAKTLSKSADAPGLDQAEKWYQRYLPYQQHLEKILATSSYCDDPRMAAHQFLLLVIGHLDQNISEPSSAERVTAAVQAFMRAYPQKRP
jgi:AcrR family transcriptional regulator